MYRRLTDIEQQVLTEVSEPRLLDFTNEISKEVRLSGSPEELRAFEYAERQLQSFGFSTELYLRDSYISLPVSASLAVGGVEYRAITHAMSQSVQSLCAPVVDVDGGTPADYAAINVRGKVVLVTGLANPPAVKAASEAGAVAAIFAHGRYTHEMIVTPVWGMPTPDSADKRPTIPVVSVNDEDGVKIRSQLQGLTDCECSITTQVDTGIRPIPTLIGELKGNEDTEDFILFSGHIDSWHFGVMDNGTANAVMLEVARILAKYKDLFKRSIRFAFWSGHSHGRYAGSTWYCDEHWEELNEHCVLHVNIDSVGAKNASVLTQGSCMAETKSLAADAIGALTGEVFEGKRMSRMGDQSFFGTGTPSLFVSLSEQPEGGLGWWWHTIEDTFDKIDGQNLVRDCKIYLLIVFRVLTDAVIPLNQLATSEEIYETLVSLQHASAGHINLSESVDRAEHLRDRLSQLYDAIAVMKVDDAAAVARVNRGLMELGRYLVPLGYVRESVFEHDLALNQPPLPKLDGISELVNADRQSESYHFLRAKIIRKVNEVQWMLKCAIQSVEETLQQLGCAHRF